MMLAVQQAGVGKGTQGGLPLPVPGILVGQGEQTALRLADQGWWGTPTVL